MPPEHNIYCPSQTPNYRRSLKGILIIARIISLYFPYKYINKISIRHQLHYKKKMASL